MTENYQKIQELLSHASMGISMCHAAYTIIDEAPAEERACLLEAFADGYGYTQTDNTMKLPKFMGSMEKARLTKKHIFQVDAHMVTLQDQDLPKEEFYKQLWEYISTSSSLPTLKARVFALYNCVVDRRLPYYPLDRTSALTMHSEDFNRYMATIGDERLGRMNYILSTHFTQKTEQASLLLTMMDSLESFEERTVFLVQLIGFFTADPCKQREHELFQILGGHSYLADLFTLCEEDYIQDT